MNYIVLVYYIQLRFVIYYSNSPWDSCIMDYAHMLFHLSMFRVYNMLERYARFRFKYTYAHTVHVEVYVIMKVAVNLLVLFSSGSKTEDRFLM